jgi:hypothetical protein
VKLAASAPRKRGLTLTFHSAWRAVIRAVRREARKRSRRRVWSG